jgi:outer membrane protein assembly factor BamE (lipoprotein component of BamABCDE complex)
MLRQPPSCAGFGELGRYNHKRRLRLGGTAVSRFLRPIMLIGARRGGFLAIVAAVATTGCSLSLIAPIVVDGQSFLLESALQLRRGMTPDEISVLLGTPLRRRIDQEGLVWSYDFRRRVKECRLSLGAIALQPVRTERHTLQLTFGSGGLNRAVYRHDAPDRTVERILVGNSSDAR